MTDPTSHPAYAQVTVAIFDALATPEMRAARDATLAAVPASVAESPARKRRMPQSESVAARARAYVMAHPGCTPRECADGLGALGGRACVRQALSDAHADGIVRREPSGRLTNARLSIWRYYPVEPDNGAVVSEAP